MYEKFFGLTQNPFGISPNPFFYFPTPRHDEAWANLWCGIQQRKGCVVVTGEVGTGKTLIVRRVMDALEGTKTKYAYVFNPRMSTDDFFGFILTDLGLNVAGQSRGQMLAQFNKFLLDVCKQQSTVALIIDEAHLLSREMLEEVRLLTNLENTQHKLLQILLVGQPELDAHIESPELRQLKQRIALRCRLEPLSRDEVLRYIAARLEKARAGSEDGRTLFSHAAIECIERYSQGIPRVINTICENALITAYARQSTMIGAEIIEQVAKDFHLQESVANKASAASASAENVSSPQLAPALASRDARNSNGGPGVQ